MCPNSDSEVRRLKEEIVAILLSAWKAAHETGKKKFVTLILEPVRKGL